MDNGKIINEILNKCTLKINGDIVSKENVLRKYIEFLCFNYSLKKHNFLIGLNNGSLCYDAITIYFLVVSCMLESTTCPSDIIRDIEGKKIVYNDTIYLVKTARKLTQEEEKQVNALKTQMNYYEFTLQDKHDVIRCKLPQSSWSKFKPYNGNAGLGNRGVRNRSKLRAFFEKVLNFQPKDIPSILNSSYVIVTNDSILQNNKIDYLLKSLTICYDNEAYKINELIPISFFSGGKETFYSGNAGKNSAVFRICNNFTDAETLAQDTNNIPLGIVVLGDNVFYKDYFSYTSLLRRTRNKFTLVSMQHNYSILLNIMNSVDICNESLKPVIFFDNCCKMTDEDYVQIENNGYTNQLSILNNRLQKSKVNIVKCDGYISWQDYRSFKNNLSSINHNSEIDDDIKENFIISAINLFNIFSLSIFNEYYYDLVAKENRIPFKTVSERFNNLLSIGRIISNDDSRKVIEFLQHIREEFKVKTPKMAFAGDLIDRNKKNVIITHKESYGKATYKYLYKYTNSRNLFFETLNSYIGSYNQYSNAIISGNISRDINGKKYDYLNCCFNCESTILLYDFEYYGFLRKIKYDYERINDIYRYNYYDDYRNLPKYVNESGSGNVSIVESKEIDEVEEIDSELKDFINKLSIIGGNKTYAKTGSEGSSFAIIFAIGKFESGEKIFFTKKYRPYVFDYKSSEVKETKVEKLQSGDVLLFTKNDDETKDLVDEILIGLIERKLIDTTQIACYQKSKRWKNVLVNYLKETKTKISEFNKKLKEKGFKIENQTIRNWIDIDSHIVGPDDAEALKMIGLITNDEDLSNNYSDYYKACSVIRNIRIKILKEIAKITIGKVSGRVSYSDAFGNEIMAKIDENAMFFTLDEIEFLTEETKCNINYINKPLDMYGD